MFAKEVQPIVFTPMTDSRAVVIIFWKMLPCTTNYVVKFAQINI